MNFIRNNIPFALMIGASGALFLTNLLIKKYTSDTIYSYFAIFIIYSGYTTSLGLLASEQVALRYAKISDKKTIIEREVLILILASTTLAAFAFSILAKLLFKEIDIYVVCLCTLTFLSACLTTIAYNHHRLQGNFNKAQFIQNSWKYFLPLLFASQYLLTQPISKESISTFLSASLLISIAISLHTLYSNRTNISIVRSNNPKYKELIISQIGFITSLSFLSMANTFDKVYIEHFLSKKEFADYFFTSLILMYPTLTLSNYIGFKEFTKIKNGADYNLNKTVTKLFLLGIAIFISNASVIYIFKESIPIFWNANIVILLMILSATRLPYSFLSAVMGAKSPASKMFSSNIISWGMSFILITLFFLLDKSLFNALLCTTLIWIMRDAVYYVYAKKNLTLALHKK